MRPEHVSPELIEGALRDAGIDTTVDDVVADELAVGVGLLSELVRDAQEITEIGSTWQDSLPTPVRARLLMCAHRMRRLLIRSGLRNGLHRR